ncbi:hypothetical protein TrLO_g10498 [Triparma laevis f. longispina]|uniref:Uncharacterized protein n=1 Tax=Triparma laevis f. longispina TaxID=1714387 RepID=A0A9W7FMD0_9STRA|nr:hypothetical protein TrLO_g10498 [Triparma laevis f. longispina]
MPTGIHLFSSATLFSMNFVISILLSLVLYSCLKSLDKRKTENSRARAAYRASWSVIIFIIAKELYEVFFEGLGIGSVSDVIAGFLGTWLASETMVEGAQTQQEKKDRRWAKKEI